MVLRIAVVLLFVFINVEAAKQLWCHQGGAKKEFGPVQCSEGTVECFKFLCSDGQAPFTARGCGVPMNAKGLRNESCFQAMGVCQYLGGQGACFTCDKKHLCNSASTVTPSLSVAIGIILLMLSPLFFV